MSARDNLRSGKIDGNLGGAALGTVWGEQLARQMLADAGFTNLEIKSVEGAIFNNYFIASKGG